MKRSEINRAVEDAMAFFEAMRFALPEYATWSPRDWAKRGAAFREVIDLGLGWDVTDFGSGDLRRVGRTIFTLRNGRADADYPKPYAQKAMHMAEGQRSVIHCHRSKMEDIFCQAGGNILIAFWPMLPDGAQGDAPLALSVSGRCVEQPAGEPLRLTPGESVCVAPFTYHQFWAEEGAGPVLSIEVSTVCNDHTDNVFLRAGERFPRIEEDEPARHALCHEYARIMESAP